MRGRLRSPRVRPAISTARLMSMPRPCSTCADSSNSGQNGALVDREPQVAEFLSDARQLPAARPPVLDLHSGLRWRPGLHGVRHQKTHGPGRPHRRRGGRGRHAKSWDRFLTRMLRRTRRSRCASQWSRLTIGSRLRSQEGRANSGGSRDRRHRGLLRDPAAACGQLWTDRVARNSCSRVCEVSIGSWMTILSPSSGCSVWAASV